MRTEINVILIVGIHTTLTTLVSEHFGQALLVSGTSILCFLMFTGVIWLVRKVHDPPKLYSNNKLKKRRKRHNGLKKYNRHRR